MKTSELTGSALDWAVAKCEGQDAVIDNGEVCSFKTIGFVEHKFLWKPSTYWSQGGVIIERESICIGSGMDAPTWYANKGLGKCHQFGTTPLIAAMRCYVASKLGDEVEIPEELK